MPRVGDRRGEAHLWLVLEEALGAAREAGDDERGIWDARRSFRAIADALIVVGAIDAERAEAVVRELDDALAVRGFIPARTFAGRAHPLWSAELQPVRRRGDGWLEAEIEHHLDLVVDLDPVGHPTTGRRVLEVLTPVVRALEACGSLPPGFVRLGDVAATFQAAGYAVDPPDHGQPDRGWLGFLRDRPAPITSVLEPVATAVANTTLGTIAGSPVRVTRLAWSELILEVEVDAPDNDASFLAAVAWRCSVFDDAGRLHLGQVGQRRRAGGPIVFRLRPGLMAGVTSMAVRVTQGAERLEDRVAL